MRKDGNRGRKWEKKKAKSDSRDMQRPGRNSEKRDKKVKVELRLTKEK
jgi:hypothetical protein